jgi:hypothetical protein
VTRALRTYRVSIDVSIEDSDADNPDNENTCLLDALDAARIVIQDTSDVDIEEILDYYEVIDE